MRKKNSSLMVVPVIAYWLIRMVTGSLRLAIADPYGVVSDLNNNKPYIVAFWHQNFFIMPYLYKKLLTNIPFYVLTSQSKDGEYITKCLSCFGISSIRGSSSKDGKKAFREMITTIKEGNTIAITPDGPRGPRHSIQQGVLKLAQSTGVPIVPVSYMLSNYKTLNTWDRFVLPIPFSKGTCLIGKPVSIDRRASEQELESVRNIITKGLGV